MWLAGHIEVLHLNSPMWKLWMQTKRFLVHSDVFLFKQDYIHVNQEPCSSCVYMWDLECSTLVCIATHTLVIQTVWHCRHSLNLLGRGLIIVKNTSSSRSHVYRPKFSVLASDLVCLHFSSVFGCPIWNTLKRPDVQGMDAQHFVKIRTTWNVSDWAPTNWGAQIH